MDFSHTSKQPDNCSDYPQFGLNVLLVEDSWSDERLISKMLSGLGCQVYSAGNLLQAGNLLKNSDIDLVLLNNSIYSRNGFDLSAVIKEAERRVGKHIPIVGLAENIIRANRVVQMENGMAELLPKPVYEAELCRIVARLAEKMEFSTRVSEPSSPDLQKMTAG